MNINEGGHVVEFYGRSYDRSFGLISHCYTSIFCYNPIFPHAGSVSSISRFVYMNPGQVIARLHVLRWYPRVTFVPVVTWYVFTCLRRR